MQAHHRARTVVLSEWVRAKRFDFFELTPYGTWRLEFVADAGTAVTGPLRLSDAALAWLQSAVFRVPVTGPVH